MKSLFLLIFLFLAGAVFIKADETHVSDEGFMQAVTRVRDPFKDPFAANLSKPMEAPKPLVKPPEPAPRISAPVEPPAAMPQEVVSLPNLKLEGVMVGEEMHQAIINGQVVGLQGTIDGARVVSMTKDGVELLFKGKKFFLKTN